MITAGAGVGAFGASVTLTSTYAAPAGSPPRDLNGGPATIISSSNAGSSAPHLVLAHFDLPRFNFSETAVQVTEKLHLPPINRFALASRIGYLRPAFRSEAVRLGDVDPRELVQFNSITTRPFIEPRLEGGSKRAVAYWR